MPMELWTSRPSSRYGLLRPPIVPLWSREQRSSVRRSTVRDYDGLLEPGHYNRAASVLHSTVRDPDGLLEPDCSPIFPGKAEHGLPSSDFQNWKVGCHCMASLFSM